MVLNDEFFCWITEHSDENTAELRLKYSKKQGDIDYAFAITQIECRRKFGKKLSKTLAQFPRFIFPSVLAGEQSSGDMAAAFHASLVNDGASVLDLTAGLGIDAMSLAHKSKSVVAVDRNPLLTECLEYNSAGMGLGTKMKCTNAICEDYIQQCLDQGVRFDTIFIDPARRDDAGGRVVVLEDCSPDVLRLMEQISKLCSKLIIKASPMLDISQVISKIEPKPSQIYVLGTRKECKELVVVVDFETPHIDTNIHCITLEESGTTAFDFTQLEEAEAEKIEFGTAIKPGNIVYEPYPAIMKGGAYKILAKKYGLNSFHPNTHVFFSPDTVTNFPGTAWTVTDILPFSSGNIKRFKNKYPQISIATRNFGMNANELRARLKVKEAPGDLKLFAVTDHKDERILIVTKARGKEVDQTAQKL